MYLPPSPVGMYPDFSEDDFSKYNSISLVWKSFAGTALHLQSKIVSFFASWV